MLWFLMFACLFFFIFFLAKNKRFAWLFCVGMVIFFFAAIGQSSPDSKTSSPEPKPIVAETKPVEEQKTEEVKPEVTPEQEESGHDQPETKPLEQSTTNASTTTETTYNSDYSPPPVKMSVNNICHAKGTEYYDRTKNYSSYNTIDECINAGGRLPN